MLIVISRFYGLTLRVSLAQASIIIKHTENLTVFISSVSPAHRLSPFVLIKSRETPEIF